MLTETVQAVAESPPSMADSGSLAARLTLRVLDGRQAGAQARMRHSRLLVGNLDAECDVVLDVGRSQRHACLLRVSSDGWTVLSVAGDLWVGESWVPPQQTWPIRSADVLTLGEVAFSLADAGVDWQTVQVPVRRQKPAGREAGGLRAELPSRARRLWHRFGAPWVGLCVVALVLGGAGTWMVLAGVLHGAVVTPREARDQLQAALSRFPWAQELSLQEHPVHSQRLVIAGYLPERALAAELEAVLRTQRVGVEHRWTAVDELQVNLARRLAVSAAEPAAVRYVGQGRFEVMETPSNTGAIDHLVRRALQDVVALQGLDLQLLPQHHAGSVNATSVSSPAVVRYVRASEAPGGVAVSGRPPLPRKAQRLDVRELRSGEMPSVVLSDGARYFEGSTLPGGEVLLKIREGQMELQSGGGEVRLVDIETGLSVAGQGTRAGG